MLAARWILRPVSLGVSLPLRPLFLRDSRLHVLYPRRRSLSWFPLVLLPCPVCLVRLVIGDLAIPRRATPFRSRRPVVQREERSEKDSYRPSMSTSDKVPRPSYTGFYPMANRGFNGASGWRNAGRG